MTDLRNPAIRERVARLETEDGLAEQLATLKSRFPELYACIDPDRLPAGDGAWATVEAGAADFESLDQGGRGDFYRLAQRDPLVRAAGIRRLFGLISPGRDLARLTPAHKVLDALGGDGVLTRALSQLVPPEAMPTILTSDLSVSMVAAAHAYNLPSVRQPAQRLVLKDNCLDGVVVAYGAHHIPPAERAQTAAEAFRVLRPGGRFALHDFEEGSPAARWFNDVVDPYSLTGHQYAHFTAGEIQAYLTGAGFVDVRVEHFYDPFVLHGDSAERAEQLLADYLLNMYGLSKLMADGDHARAWGAVYALAAQCFRYDYARMGLAESFGAPCIQTTRVDGAWRIEMPRVALVGSGVKG